MREKVIVISCELGFHTFFYPPKSTLYEWWEHGNTWSGHEIHSVGGSSSGESASLIGARFQF